MPHCTKCGAEVAASAQFCQKCGQPQVTPGVRPSPPSPPFQPATSGLSENAAATLSYVLVWITGIIFYLIDSRPYVRFHAAQSIVTFGGLHVIRVILGLMFGMGFWFGRGHLGGFGIGLLLISLVQVVGFVLWIVCMLKAFQGTPGNPETWFMVPVAGEIATNLAKR